jgi:hypothetical protein
MLKRFFLGIKIILIVTGFFLAANEQHGESWLMMGLFWMATGVESAVRSYREKGEIPYSFSVVFVVGVAVLVTVGFITL